MPYIRLTLAGTSISPQQLARLQQGMTDLMVNRLRKERALTVVSVAHDPLSHWSAGGETQTGGNAMVQAFITAGTNSGEEKAAFIRETRQWLETELGALTGPVYVVVQEVPASDWGYDGATQEARRLTREAQP